MSMQATPAAPRRIVHHGDALPWLAAQGRIAGASVVTSLPDVSELPALGFDGWRRWFVAAARAAMGCGGEGRVARFFPSDHRRHGVWIDKGALVAAAADE